MTSRPSSVVSRGLPVAESEGLGAISEVERVADALQEGVSLEPRERAIKAARIAIAALDSLRTSRRERPRTIYVCAEHGLLDEPGHVHAWNCTATYHKIDLPGPLPADREQPEGEPPKGVDPVQWRDYVRRMDAREQLAGLRQAAQRVLDAQSWEAIIFAKAELRAALLDAAALPEGRE
jgi:hypothetical protein